MRNSTIRIKKKICTRCGNECYWFSKKRCKQCATIEDTLARMEEDTNAKLEKEGLSFLIKEADAVYSQWLRKSQADANGMVCCFTCNAVLRWQDAQCGHYIKRGNLFLRFDQRNTKIQDKSCNEYKAGNYLEYTKRLESESPGLVDILTEEAALVYKPTRDEIRSIINEYTKRLKQLKQC